MKDKYEAAKAQIDKLNVKIAPLKTERQLHKQKVQTATDVLMNSLLILSFEDCKKIIATVKSLIEENETDNKKQDFLIGKLKGLKEKFRKFFDNLR